ncbi:GNAT family N-acetyltransferase [Streptomyces sp. NPDC086777]|uniref:GNAT family N-acetyltransferase n=1 Tax=Streptomyces sp. NPDC086777 TaxID=3154866 RepID=UPI00344CE56E
MNSASEGRLPVLRRWMGDGQTHPLRVHMDRPSKYPGIIHAWWRDPVLTCLEETLVLLETAQPQGLDSMARTFRGFDDPSWAGKEQFLRHRAELVVASLLAEARVPFRFNTAAGPDLLMDNVFPCMGIEISSRRPKSLFDLSQALHEGLRERGLALSAAGKVDLGYMFLPRVWGFGYAAEACTAALDWFDGVLPGEPVVLHTQTANVSSMRLAVKLGFTEVERFHAWDAEQWFGMRSPVTPSD